MLDCQFCNLASEGPVIIINQLKSIDNSPFKDSHSHPINTCFPIIASKGIANFFFMKIQKNPASAKKYAH